MVITENNINDVLKTCGLIVVPIITAVFLFRLTKRKEHTYKKRELCGEIYGCIFEIRQLYFINTFYQISFAGNNAIYQQRNNPNYAEDYPHPDHQGEFATDFYQKQFNDAHIALDKNHTQLIQVHRNLSKAVGQYRLYLKKSKRKRFDELYKPTTYIADLIYDFSDLKNIREMEQRIDSLTKSYPEDFRKKYHPAIDAMYLFLERNN